MPVDSRSSFSSAASHFLPSRIAIRKLSISSLKPSFITLPSRKSAGGSSFIALSSKSHTSSSKSKFLRISPSIGDLTLLKVYSSSGNCKSVILSAIKSFGVTVPSEIRLIILDISYVPESTAERSSRSIIFSVSSFTEYNLLFISIGLISGFSIHCFKSLAPIDVSVLSSTHKSEPLLTLSRIVSVISRLRLVLTSYVLIVFKYVRLVFCVCSKYAIIAPTARTA